jgi:hypothetical protein
MEIRSDLSESEPFEVLLGRLGLVRFLVDDAGLVSGCSAAEARRGLAAVELAVRSLQALMVGFVTRLDAGRDTVAAVKRVTGVSASVARGLAAAAVVVEENPPVGVLLSSGELSVDHIVSLGGLTPETIERLLPLAVVEVADVFRRTVTEYRVLTEANTLEEEQQLSRSVTFFTKRNGCVGATVVLPPVPGATFRNTLNELCDQAWRAAHPERAEVAGGHDEVEPRERRVADALITWMSSKTLQLGKPVVVITCDLDTMTAVLHPNQPINVRAVADITAKADCYAAIRDGTNIANLRFGRNRRFATHLQKLALQVLQPVCVFPGCDTPSSRSDVHHLIEYEHGGCTDIENLACLCNAHHRHLHLNNITLRHKPNGQWALDESIVASKPSSEHTKHPPNQAAA